MKILIILIVGIFAVANAASIAELVREEWNSFKATHRKDYRDEVEEKFRMHVFIDNKHKIAKHNQRYEAGEVSFKMGVNKYSDLLNNEFRTILNGYNKTGFNEISNHQQNKLTKALNNEEPVTFISPANVELPNSVDWRNKGAVTPIKDQGHCGSCWSFSATGALEGQHFRKTGVLVSLSEQNLVDCSTTYGNNGCNGGLMDYAFKYIKENGGLDTEKTYPYEGQDDTCRYNAANSGATDKGFVDIPQGNEKKLKEALATIGPVSVAIDASQESFQFYTVGVYDEINCSSTELDHGVLAVGYGTDENGKDYWLVKNSWGTSWGDKGYIKMARNQNNQCGIATSASYPLV